MNTAADIQSRFWPAFARVMGRPIAPGHYQTADVAQWDSLRHVELMFELEECFGVSIPPARIADLFSDTDAILAYLCAEGAAK